MFIAVCHASHYYKKKKCVNVLNWPQKTAVSRRAFADDGI